MFGAGHKHLFLTVIKVVHLKELTEDNALASGGELDVGILLIPGLMLLEVKL